HRSPLIIILLGLVPPPSHISSMSNIPSSSAVTPPCVPEAPRAGDRARPSVAQGSRVASLIDHPSVFEVLNIFRARWFVNHEHLLSCVLSAVKGGDDNSITWVDLLPAAHSGFLRQASSLAPKSYPLSLLKRVMFTHLLEVINSHGYAVDKFIKTSAPRHRRAPHPAPLTPLDPAPVLDD